ncbi:MurR/RpiR family transcriptional regulator [Fundicoccus ignavus]|uniref:SIS domain-containing protein n=1 Tax=Fundicoccus ignavus TaxID=2664442 RepID=A0A844C9S8_9LACT|nr:MurR/RpiR family transcriptional regulator [Fundicoccus ignavus]MRJ46171.1 SIS domain-containing protein [Fundicoccus ignavus]
MAQTLLMTIKNILSNLPESERKIGQLILEKPTEIIQMSATKLAAEAGSSSAAVIRFCNSIGLKSFTEFKIQLSGETAQIDMGLLTDIAPGEAIDDIKRKLLFNTNFFFEKTTEVLKNEVIDQVVDAIAAAPAVFIHGLGASFLVASDMKQKFSRIGKQVFCTQDTHELSALMAIAVEGSTYVGISNSGEKIEGLVLMKLAKQLGLTTISLTKDSNNPLRNTADIALAMADTQEAPLRSGATISLLSQMFAVDIIFYHYMAKNYNQNISGLNKTRNATATYEKLLDSV